jgi:hypothetical protein
MREFNQSLLAIWDDAITGVATGLATMVIKPFCSNCCFSSNPDLKLLVVDILQRLL